MIPNQFTHLLRDSKHRLWLGGDKGVSVYTEKQQFTALPYTSREVLREHQYNQQYI